jgi:hypothetical protein
VDSDLEIFEQLAMMIGFKALGLSKRFAQAKVFHDVAEHNPILYI